MKNVLSFISTVAFVAALAIPATAQEKPDTALGSYGTVGASVKLLGRDSVAERPEVERQSAANLSLMNNPRDAASRKILALEICALLYGK
jgi:hypothetical protein